MSKKFPDLSLTLFSENYMNSLLITCFYIVYQIINVFACIHMMLFKCNKSVMQLKADFFVNHTNTY
jgi:hypothetical protein